MNTYYVITYHCHNKNIYRRLVHIKNNLLYDTEWSSKNGIIEDYNLTRNYSWPGDIDRTIELLKNADTGNDIKTLYYQPFLASKNTLKEDYRQAFPETLI